MTQEHPITPPPELVAQIRRDALHKSDGQLDYELKLIHDAYRAGADQQLQLDAEQINRAWQKGWILPEFSVELRDARRPKPPSLKEEALEAAQRFYANGHHDCSDDEIKGDFDIIRRALEALPD